MPIEEIVSHQQIHDQIMREQERQKFIGWKEKPHFSEERSIVGHSGGIIGKVLEQDYLVKHKEEREKEERLQRKKKAESYAKIVREMKAIEQKYTRPQDENQDSNQDPPQNLLGFKNYTNEKFNMHEDSFR